MKKSVSFYTTAAARVEIPFPGGEEVCQWCLFCQKDPANFLRLRCLLTGELLPLPEHGRGRLCPLKMEGGEEHV